MTAVYTNILVYAHRQDMDGHTRAAELVQGLAEGRLQWAIPWPCLHEFYGVITNPRIFKHPTPVHGALDQIRAWLESPSVVTLAEGPGYWNVLDGLVTAARVKGPMIHDARIAAPCLHHGVRELWTADRDFSRFQALHVKNPLVGRS